MAEAMTDEHLMSMVDSYKRKRLTRTASQSAGDSQHRVYVNRSVSMDRIKYVGFDMDYTLVEYKSPDYESMCFKMVLQRLISIGYPSEIQKMEYDPNFPLRYNNEGRILTIFLACLSALQIHCLPLVTYMVIDRIPPAPYFVRLHYSGVAQSMVPEEYDLITTILGLFFDKSYGNLLKADQFGNILSCFHGFKSLSSTEIRSIYPNKYLQPSDENRVHILYTLFHLPEIYLLAALVDFFENCSGYSRIEDGPDKWKGVKCGDVLITYKMIWWDVRTSIDWLHVHGNAKEETVKNLEKYVVKDPNLPHCIHKLRQSGMKTFIATNSDFKYTQKIMTYLFDYHEAPDGGPHRNWREYFDYVIVDAKKPLFFAEGSMLREVDKESGSLKLGVFTGALKPGQVYSGGSSDAFCKYTGAKGKEILYVGDHIFGDVIKAKKEQAWRTFLVLPELKAEVKVWESTQSLFLRLQNLTYLLAEVYGTDSDTHYQRDDLPDMESIRKALKVTSQNMEDSYPSQLGSLLRCGSRLTHFAIMANRFADLYSSSCVNLMYYPSNYLFTAPHQLMVHETNPTDTLPISPALPNTPTLQPRSMRKLPRGMSIVDHDVDLEDDNGIRKRSSHDEVP